MRILERKVYGGPLLHAHFPLIRLVLDLGPLEAWPTASPAVPGGGARSSFRTRFFRAA